MGNLPKIQANDEINAALVLTNGQFFFGRGVGSIGEATGEICFNTSITGYQEILTDPSYTGQIINFTTPHIGNVGTNSYDNESEQKFAGGLIIREDITDPANFRSENSFNEWLKENNLTGISNVDTRQITNIIRNSGVLNAIISFKQNGQEIDIAEILERAKKLPSFEGIELSSKVSTEKPHTWQKTTFQFNNLEKISEANDRPHVVVIDYGVKENILNCLLSENFKVTVVNCKTPASEILSLNPNGVFLSNGPGDPASNAKYSSPIIQEILKEKIPVFGICMGHQLLALASGLKTYKMHQGHRGVNHPVKNLVTGTVEITSQNHGFAVDDKNLPENIEITHISLFDKTVEGLRLKDRPAFSVQYHPESSAGPHDSRYLFKDFMKLIKEHNA